MLGAPRCTCHAAVKCSLYWDALCGLFVQNRVLGTFWLGYLVQPVQSLPPLSAHPEKTTRLMPVSFLVPCCSVWGSARGSEGRGARCQRRQQAGPMAWPCPGSGLVSWEAGDFTARRLFPELLICRSGAKVETGGALTRKWVLRGCCIRVVSSDHRTGHTSDQVVINALLSESARQLGMGKAAG